MDPVSRRASRAAESILENESLTANLDDAAAQVLIDWGIDSAEMIAQYTVGLDDPEAEEVMAPRLRALRQLMRLVNQAIPDLERSQREKDKGYQDVKNSLDKITEQAAIIYGPDFSPPTQEQQEAFLERNVIVPDATSEPKSSDLIKKLRTFIETPKHKTGNLSSRYANSNHPQEERDEQEEEKDPEQNGDDYPRYHPRALWKLLFGDRR
jgi:hypothetical protein